MDTTRHEPWTNQQTGLVPVASDGSLAAQPAAAVLRPSARHMRESGGPDRSSPSWDLILKPPVAQKICAFAFRLQHQAGMVAAAIPATMGDDGYKFLMQKPAHPVQRYMNPDDFSDISLNPVKVRFAFLH